MGGWGMTSRADVEVFVFITRVRGHKRQSDKC